VCAYVCFLLNISLETWAEFSESKIKKMPSYCLLEGGLQQPRRLQSGGIYGIDRRHPDGEIEMKATWGRGELSLHLPSPVPGPLTLPRLIPALPARL